MLNGLTEEQLRARENFPTGLEQPGDSYRFGIDALLLAAFSVKIASLLFKRKNLRAVELGGGCGAALLAFAMLNPEAECEGFEYEETLVKCARDNAAKLGIENASFFQADLTADKRFMAERQHKYDLVFANPPWREAGRETAKPLRHKALWACKDVAKHFYHSASIILKSKGFFCCIQPSENLLRFYDNLKETELGMRAIIPVAAFPEEPASRILILSQKNAKSLPRLEAPLILYAEKTQPKNKWSKNVLAFCPWLNKN